MVFSVGRSYGQDVRLKVIIFFQTQHCFAITNDIINIINIFREEGVKRITLMVNFTK